MAKMLGNTPHGCRYAVCRCRHCRGHGQEDEQRRRAQRAREHAQVRAELDALVREAAELGLYELTAEPRDTR